ncbi:MAG: right-handed parallel beta-helix repeat-containing protein [Lewinellaceae bacterium]|nr:right-handed parallel beta-helix repeat-containing protein [Lewinellaceae bacterium]
MNSIRLWGMVCGISAFLIISWSCDRELDFITDSSARVAFSVDTLRFDTVFTEIGSATRLFKVYNRNDRPIRISRIYLESGAQSRFRINVDGRPGGTDKRLEDIEIYANDSIYVFAEVTVDPDQPLSISPFVIEENLIFETNENVQRVLLEAWGQNANYFPSRFNGGVPVVLSCDNGVINWNDPKPYVIYGVVFIDSCTLNIPAGTQIYVHGGIARNDIFDVYNDGILYMLPNGKLRIQGTAENPVVIQGDRLEEDFQENPGQWTGIVIGRRSRGNLIEYATVKNSIFGIYADSAAEVTLRNTRIFNTNSSGLIGVRSRITAENCLIYNNQANSVQLLHGGDYNFTYCTVASYGVNASALGMSNFLCYDDALSCRVRSDYRLNASFRNCIIYGSDRDEIRLSDISGGQNAGLFNVRFENCLVRVDDLLREQEGRFANFFDTTCKPCLNGTFSDKVFADVNEDNYRLDSLSIARRKGLPILLPRIINIDIEGKVRDAQNPDLGCFERGN